VNPTTEGAIMQGTILVATAGQGVIRSSDNGATWARTPLGQALEFDGVVRCVVIHPDRPEVVFAGADVGLVRSHDAGHSWTRVDGPFNDMQIWTIAIDPVDSDFMLVGSGAPARAYVWRSTDGGATWDELSPRIPEHCAGVSKPRILTSTVDPADGDQLWFGIEEGGLWRSGDRGDTWLRIDKHPKQVPDTVTNSDVHAVLVLPGEPKTHLVVTVNAIWTSRDGGESWKRTVAAKEFGYRYARTVAALADGRTVLFACGDSTPGTVTRIFKSGDQAESWQETTFDVAPNSTVWGFAVHPADPSLVFAGTKYGHLFRSTDSGDSWTKEWREFPEITALAWTPAIARADNAH
jgi:photosystem II stability/assembly factor-like uncharacterized protein